MGQEIDLVEAQQLTALRAVCRHVGLSSRRCAHAIVECCPRTTPS